LDKLSWNLLSILGQETVQADNRVVNWLLYIETAPMCHGPVRKCRKSGQEEESSHHIPCQCPALAGRALEVFGSALLEPVDVSRASVWMVLAVSVVMAL
jgi:hypothetical protein